VHAAYAGFNVKETIFGPQIGEMRKQWAELLAALREGKEDYS
jgi:hypothetical protein